MNQCLKKKQQYNRCLNISRKTAIYTAGPKYFREDRKVVCAYVV